MDSELTITSFSSTYVKEEDIPSGEQTLASIAKPEPVPSDDIIPNSKISKRGRSLSLSNIGSMVKNINFRVFNRSKTDKNSDPSQKEWEGKHKGSARVRSMSVSDISYERKKIKTLKSKPIKDDIELIHFKEDKKQKIFDIEILDPEAVQQSMRLHKTNEVTIEHAIAKIEEVKINEEASAERIKIFDFIVNIFKSKTPLDSTHVLGEKKILKFAEIEFDDKNYFHRSLIMTVWKNLMSTTKDCSIIGEHWKQLGFTGNSPGEDLLSVGPFGLVCIIFLLQKFPVLAKDIFTYSQSPIHYFPFAKISIQLSEKSLKYLKEGILNKIINKNKYIFATVLEFYCGAFMVWLNNYRNKKWVGDYEPEFIYERTHGVTEAFIKQNPGETVKMAQVLYKNSKYASFLNTYE
ncbi:unnamed protein product [Blepharisma stoltei]|uniref:ELMO domain-containing protein n=1 Tax=Blepharisma stoltei TaxID=1481888 RepID=A0AAU9IZX0_9CILI|nr:unnamed protein product [Blepharisma stoltei]